MLFPPRERPKARSATRAYDVGDGEVQEDLHRPHTTGLGDELPLEMQAVRIEDAEGAAIVLPSRLRQDVAEQDTVAVAMMNPHVRSLPGESLERRNFLLVEIDEVVLAEGRLDPERVQRASRNELARGL